MLRHTFAKLLPPGTPSVTVSLAPTTAWRYVRWGVGLGLGAAGLVLLYKQQAAAKREGGRGGGVGSISGVLSKLALNMPQLLGSLGLGSRKKVTS